MLGVDVGAIAALPIFNSVYNYVSLFIYAVYPKKKKKKCLLEWKAKYLLWTLYLLDSVDDLSGRESLTCENYCDIDYCFFKLLIQF